MNFRHRIGSLSLWGVCAIGLAFFMQLLFPHITRSVREGPGQYVASVAMPDYHEVSPPNVDFVYHLVIHAPVGAFIARQWHFLPDDCVTAIAVDGNPLPIASISQALRCDYVRGFSFPLGDSLHGGDNAVDITIHNVGGAYGLGLDPELCSTPVTVISFSASLLCVFALLLITIRRKQPAGLANRQLVGWLLLAGVGLVIRAVWLPQIAGDMNGFLLNWWRHIVLNGFPGYATAFSNYAPAYTYLLGFAAWLRPSFSPVIAIKLISITFDMLAAFATYLLVKRRYPAQFWPAYAAASLVWLNPYVIIDSAAWGQSDSIFTSFMLLSLYGALERRPFLSMLHFALGFCIKPQAMFFAPVLLVFMLRRRMPVYYALTVPAIYLLSCIPCAIAGRKWLELIMIYPHQTATGARRGGLASVINMLPEPYWWIWDKPIVVAVFCIAALLSVAFAYNRAASQGRHVVLFATTVTFLFPMLIPQMWDRYFYLAQLLSVTLIFYMPRLWVVFLSLQLTTYLINWRMMLSALIKLDDWFVYGFCVGINTMILLMLLRHLYGRQLILAMAGNAGKLLDSTPLRRMEKR